MAVRLLRLRGGGGNGTDRTFSWGRTKARLAAAWPLGGAEWFRPDVPLGDDQSPPCRRHADSGAAVATPCKPRTNGRGAAGLGESAVHDLCEPVEEWPMRDEMSLEEVEPELGAIDAYE